ncbi:hypothetical protein A0H76_1456 [Hepatospora eriocheir]|uniref:Uncharacterized protein n=1 Tax=Hepatospora eriocheir TaxID=1081669 RepID=A0A1X0QH14_9MICR|nr:hypothetical protein A0H76_1456 [Hepatospora eriocheir]
MNTSSGIYKSFTMINSKIRESQTTISNVYRNILHQNYCIFDKKILLIINKIIKGTLLDTTCINILVGVNVTFGKLISIFLFLTVYRDGIFIYI